MGKRPLLIALSTLLLFVIVAKARPELCELPKVVGMCRAAIKSYYYDASVGQCMKFIYGGCQGNANRFDSLADIEAVFDTANDRDGIVSYNAASDPDWDSIVSYNAASDSQSGYITKYQCTDWTCATCSVISRESTKFGTCQRDGSNYHKSECYGGSFLMSDIFDNSGCDGSPDNTFMSGVCDNEGDYENEIWVRYDCYISVFKSANEDEASGTVNANVTIAVVTVVSVIGAIGIIVGCLMYKKGKKSAELKMLLDDDASAIAA